MSANPYELALDEEVRLTANARREDNPYEDALADEAFAGRASLASATAVDPDQAARAAKLAQATGVPPSVAERNAPALERRLLADQYDALPPVLQQRVADPQFAKVARDDLGPLSRLADWAGRVGRSIAERTGAVVTNLAVDPANVVGDLLPALDAGLVIDSRGVRFARGDEYRERSLARIIGEGGDNLDAARSTLVSTDEIKARWESGDRLGAARDAAQYAVESGLVSLPDMVAAIAAFPQYVLGQGSDYAQRRAENDGRERVEGSDAAVGLLTSALVSSLERLGADAVFDRLGGSGTAARRWLEGILAEATTEAVQNPVETFGTQAGTARGVTADELAESALFGAIGGAGGGATIGGAVQAVRTIRERRTRAQEDAAALEALRTAAAESKLRTRDPEAFAGYVQRAAEDAGAPTEVYVSAEALARAGIANPEATPGGDVAVPVGVFATLDPEMQAQLAPDVRTAPDALTAREAEQEPDLVAELAGERMIVAEGNVTPEEFAAARVAETEAAEAAARVQRERGLRDLQWLENRTEEALRDLRREGREARAQLDPEARAEVMLEPVYAVTQGGTLSPRALQRLYAAPGQLDAVAESYGFPSGDALLAAVRSAEPFADVVEARIEQRLMESRPELADRIAAQRAAEARVADRARLRFVATEAAALSAAVGNRAVLAQEARTYAEAQVARRQVQNVRPYAFRMAAQRARREAGTAFRRGDTPLAAQKLTEEVLQQALATEAALARDEIDSAVRQFRRIAAKREDGTRDAAMANLTRATLAAYGLSPVAEPAATYLEQVRRYDPETAADLGSLVEGLPAARDWRSLTVADFRLLRERVDALWSLAKSTRELEIDGQRVAIDQAATALADQLSIEPATPPELVVGTNDRLDLRMKLAGIKAALRRVEFWVDARDRGNAAGPFRRFIWQPVSEAVTRYRALRNEQVAAFRELLRPIEGTLKPGKIAAPELGTGVTFADRSALLHALLHVGNESNRRKLLLGYRWAAEREDGSLDTSRWDAFLDRMHREKRITEGDWRFVQGVWDLLEQSKPKAQDAHRKMFGYYFAEVTAEPVVTPFGTFRGGYVPAITDSLRVPEARSYGAMDDLLASQNSPMFPAVARGFTKARVEDYTRPLALDLQMIPAHLDKVARFAELGPVLRDTARLVARNRTFRGAMDAVDPQAVEGMLVPWLKRVATQSLTKAPETEAGRAVARIANTLRNRTGLMMMSANVVNTLQQFTGLSVAALRVKPAHLGGALWEVLRRPTGVGREIAALSPWMAQRADVNAQELDREVERLLVNPNALRRAEQLGTRYGYLLQQHAQNFLDRIVWLGAYRQAASAGRSDVEAVREADAAVRMTQSSFAPEDASKVEHADSFTRLFLQFYSYFNGQANMLATEVRNAEGRKARLAVVYLLGFAVPAVLADVIAQGIRGSSDEDEEDDEVATRVVEAALLSQARYALGALPVVGQVGNAALGQLTPERFDDRIGASPTYSALESTIRSPFSIYSALAEDGNPRAAVRDSLTAVGVLTGLPTGPLVRPLGYLADEDREGVTVRGLVTGRDPE